jgi:hypothetical protein
MQMKKKLSVLLLGLVFAILLFSTNSLAIQNDTSYKDGQIISESDTLDEAYLTYTTEELSVLKAIPDNSIDPLADELKKPKTITRKYTNFSDITEYYPYPEYSDGHWRRGNLPLVKAERVNGGWIATFSGYIYTIVE